MRKKRFSFVSAILVGVSLASISALAQTNTVGTNHFPEVRLIAPTNGTVCYTPTNITLSAAVSDPAFRVQKVEFFAGTNSLGTSTNQLYLPLPAYPYPYRTFSLVWSNVPAGSYVLTARASGGLGNSSVSAGVSIVVHTGPVPNLPPTVSIAAPANGATYVAPARVNIYALAGDADGSVKKVEFFAGTHSLGVSSNLVIVYDPPAGTTNFPNPNPPVQLKTYFTFSWTNVPAGSYALTAVATDNGGATGVSAPVNITVQPAPPPPTNQPPVVSIASPSTNAVFYTPVNIPLYAYASDRDDKVASVEFFAGTNSLGLGSKVLTSSTSTEFTLVWSNAPAGSYVLTAVATDSRGASTTSAAVGIVVKAGPPPNVPPTVSILEPGSGAKFTAPANVGIYASASDSDGTVVSVEFFSGTNSLGVVSNSPIITPPTPSPQPLPPTHVFSLRWTNVAAGTYVLTAAATDNSGATTVSAPVNITVQAAPPPPPPPTNRPPEVRIISPFNNATYRAPVNIPLYAFAADKEDGVASLEFFAGTHSLGLGARLTSGSNSLGSEFTMVWSNVPSASYALTAVATDAGGLSSTSAVVNVTVLPSLPPPTDRPTVVTIVATDPVAIEGTNCWVTLGVSNIPPVTTNWPTIHTRLITNCGPKNASFTVRRRSDTNADLTVAYTVGGTASNGVEYISLSGSVTIPAGQRTASIVVVPVDDNDTDPPKTVVVTLSSSTNSPADYRLGYPQRAAVVIIDSNRPRLWMEPLTDRSFHLNTSGPEGAWFHIESSTNLTDWTSLCTNQVINGSVDFVDPDANGAPHRYYRTVPEANAPQ